jgi:hypothetical protein
VLNLLNSRQARVARRFFHANFKYSVGLVEISWTNYLYFGILSLLVLGTVLATFYCTILLGPKATYQWLVCVMSSLVLDFALFSPLRILAKSFLLSLSVNSAVCEALDAVCRRARLCMLRRGGLVKTANSLIQHFNGACRAARQFPELDISRLLMSFNDNDFPNSLQPTAEAVKLCGNRADGDSSGFSMSLMGCMGSIVSIFISLPLTLLLLLPQWTQDFLLDALSTGIPMVIILAFSYLQGLQLVLPAAAILLLLGLVIVFDKCCCPASQIVRTHNDSLQLNDSLFEDDDENSDIQIAVADQEACNAPNFTLKWKHRVVVNSLKPKAAKHKKRAISPVPSKHKRVHHAEIHKQSPQVQPPSPHQQVHLHTQIHQALARQEHQHAQQHHHELLQTVAKSTATQAQYQVFDDIHEVDDGDEYIPIIDDQIPIGRVLTSSIAQSSQSSKSKKSSGSKAGTGGSSRDSKRFKQKHLTANSFMPHHLDIRIDEEEHKISAEDWRRSGWVPNSTSSGGSGHDHGTTESVSAVLAFDPFYREPKEINPRKLVQDLDREREIENRGRALVDRFTHRPANTPMALAPHASVGNPNAAVFTTPLGPVRTVGPTGSVYSVGSANHSIGSFVAPSTASPSGVRPTMLTNNLITPQSKISSSLNSTPESLGSVVTIGTKHGKLNRESTDSAAAVLGSAQVTTTPTNVDTVAAVSREGTARPSSHIYNDNGVKKLQQQPDRQQTPSASASRAYNYRTLNRIAPMPTSGDSPGTPISETISPNASSSSAAVQNARLSSSSTFTTPPQRPRQARPGPPPST